MIEKRKLRIVFMGTPDFAVATLAKLVDTGYDVVGVVTAPDRPAGRGMKLQESAVKQFSLERGLTILQPVNLKDPRFLEELRALDANLQIVVAFRMLPKQVWQMPAYGTFNLHASLLPDYRGAAPINWALINGETETGATTFFIDEKIDTGEIIVQKKLPIGAEETAGMLHDRLMFLGADLVIETVDLIENDTVQRKKQEQKDPIKPAHKIYRENCEIDWERPIQDVHNLIRGLSPYPAAWTTLLNEGKRVHLKIYSAAMEHTAHDFLNGDLIIDKKEMKVAVKEGFITLLEIQFPGKRKMKTAEVLNGLNLPKISKLVQSPTSIDLREV